LGVLTVAAQSDSAASMLALYRAGLHLRRTAPWSGDGAFRWIESAEQVLAFARGERFRLLRQLWRGSGRAPGRRTVLISSSDLEGGALPQDTAVWLRQTKGQVPLGDTS
jgi:hypothetical protein